MIIKSGVTTRAGNRISKTKASFIPSTPFHIGLFKYGGEIIKGKHEPIISKEQRNLVKKSFFALRLGGGIK
ncbi:MAG: hypothetical protein Q8P07_02860 [bacterium]|nr:hypothetical protein [bacterium]